MMKADQYNTSLVEFTYTVAREVPVYLKRFLPEGLYRKISTPREAMKFASRSTLEQKREFFSYLGIQNFLIFADMHGEPGIDFRELFRQFEPVTKPAATLKKMADANIFVSSNKEFIYQLGYLSQLADTPSYTRNLELLRTSYHVNKLAQKINLPEHKQAIEEKETSSALVRYMYGVMWATDMCENVTTIDSNTMRMLMLLYLNRHTYLSYEKIVQIFAGSISSRQATFSRRILLDKVLIQKHSIAARKEYTITARGILVVNQFRDKVIKSFDF